MQNPVIKLSVDVQGVQQIVRALGRLPFDDVSSLIPDLIRQTNEQISAANAPQQSPTKDTSEG